MTRKAWRAAADVSERHLANLEYGIGNASILVLLQVARALQCSLAELMGDVTTSSPEWLLMRELLEHRDEATLRRARVAVASCWAPAAPTQAARASAAHGADRPARRRQVHAGPDAGRRPGLSLRRAEPRDREVRRLQHQRDPGLYGQNAYRRYERRALEEAIQIYPEAVIATPGGLVSDPANFNLLLAHCTTVWLQADPEDHMKPRAAQGDLRPMAASREAMDDLKSHPGRARGLLFEGRVLA
jgi:XRE family aerobic/anaerobic benzoate catabolism transcriptional regulator